MVIAFFGGSCVGGVQDFVVVAFYDVSHIFNTAIANFDDNSIKDFVRSVACGKIL